MTYRKCLFDIFGSLLVSARFFSFQSSTCHQNLELRDEKLSLTGESHFEAFETATVVIGAEGASD